MVGCAGAITYKAERVFKRMLELDTFRGPHSTGIFCVKGDKSTHLAKALGTPWDLAETHGFTQAFTGIAKVLIGHNRWATKGKINKANAHPFEFKNLAGAHNGTLRTTHQLDDNQLFDVDSENLYHHMDKHGVYDTIPKLNGAFALTWYDKNHHTVNLLRNEERPLYYAFNNDLTTLYWASEPWMIRIAAAQAEEKIQDVIELPVGVLHTFEVPAFSQDRFQKTNLRQMEMYKYVAPRVTVKVEDKKVVRLLPKDSKDVPPGKTRRPFSAYQPYIQQEVIFSVGSVEKSKFNQAYLQCWAVDNDDISIKVFAQPTGSLWETMVNSTGYFKGLAKSYSESDGPSLTIDLRTIEAVLEVAEDVPAVYPGFGGEELSEEEFYTRSKSGCAWCASPILPADAFDVVWFAKDDCLCADCAKQPEVKQYLVNE